MNPPNTMTQRLDEAYERYGAACAEIQRSKTDWFHANGIITSPIEIAMADALLIMETGYGWEHEGHLDIIPSDFSSDSRLIVQIVPQKVVGPYRLDFAIRVRNAYGAYHFFAVECDGHDFHEKTKRQAAHDRRRDRFLQSSGYRVYRFTGSEIYADPKKCADEIGAAVSNVVYPRSRP
jgi:very-short-patch-repair endonuclease